MKVLCFMNHADKGGAALAFIELIEHLHKNYDVECVVYTGKQNEINKRCSKQGIENYSAPFKNFISSYHSPSFLWRLAFKIRHFLGNRAALRQIEEQVDISSFDIIYTNLDRIDIGAIISKKYGVPHVWHIREHLDTDFKVISVYREYTKYMRNFPSKFVAISNSVKNAWVKRGFKPEEIITIYDGICVEKIAPKQRWFINDKVNFLFLGGYTKEKGQIDFINNLNDLRTDIKNQISITFFGSNYEREKNKLDDAALKSNVSDIVTFMPYTNEIYNLIKDYDVGINFSDEEGFGRVTVEYMSAGLCVLCSNSGANRELVKENLTGFLIEKSDGESLKKMIEFLVKHKDLIKITGNNAAKYSSMYSSIEHAKNIYELFNEVQRGI